MPNETDAAGGLHGTGLHAPGAALAMIQSGDVPIHSTMPSRAAPGIMLAPTVPRGVTSRLRGFLAWFVHASALMVSHDARADRPQWAFQVFPFAQKMNMDTVYAVTHSAPGNLLQSIQESGVDVRRVRSKAPTRPLNPLLATLPEAEPELLQRAEFQDSYEGREICGPATPDSTAHDTILIRDVALNYTLIHEFVQSLLRPLCLAEVDEAVELRFSTAFRRLVVYQQRLYDDPYLLLNPLWRRDILAAHAEVAERLFDRIRIGQSQEAIVEKVLSRYIDERSPYFDAARRAQGRQYAENMIDNAIDLFNAVHDSMVFVEHVVADLRAGVRDGHIEQGDSARLTDDDVESVRLAIRRVTQTMEVVKVEIEELKRFQSR